MTGVERGVRQWIIARIQRSATDRMLGKPQSEVMLCRHCFEHAHCLGDDFRADAIAR
jgi:hypothetical protein